MNRLLVAVTVLISGAAAAFAAGAEEIRMTVGRSVVIDSPADVRQISTSNPDVVDANPISTREIVLHARATGSATVIIWANGSGRRTYQVSVEPNVEPLRDLMRETFPGEAIQVRASRDAVSLTGRVSTQQIAERAGALAAPFAKAVVNNLVVSSGPVMQQILLRVKFAELDRSRASQFGVNLVSTGAGNTIGRITTGQFGAPTVDAVGNGRSSFTVSDALNIFAFRPDLDLAAFIKALQNESILQILAEPNLVAANGKEANFVVGGEFPVPVVQGGANAGAITIQFREFGIRLSFIPAITENQTVRLHLRQEVSTIDMNNSVSMNGYVIPALSTRRAETDVELVQRQSFVVAGLIDNRETESYSKIPGLSAVPLLGQLFRSKDTRASRTELVMIVTPEITDPASPSATPGVPNFPREFLVPIDPAPKQRTEPVQGPSERVSWWRHFTKK